MIHLEKEQGVLEREFPSPSSPGEYIIAVGISGSQVTVDHWCVGTLVILTFLLIVSES